jgi:hypothetical protein
MAPEAATSAGRLVELVTVAHRMGLLAGRGGVRGGWPRRGAPEAELSELSQADVVLGLGLAIRAPAGGPDLGEARLLPEVLPSFLLERRLDPVSVIGAALAAMANGRG